MSELQRQLQLLPDYLGNHLLLSFTSLVLGIVICLPLGIIVTRIKQLQWPVLTLASVLQTVPGLALLALMVPLLGQIGFLPAFIALVLYSMLPILRNTVTGILSVDASMTEAARGVGMTDFQQLTRVELPLALPVIIAGIRTAAVWVVGTATLSTPVGATSLGNYIFGGLQTQNYTAVMVGCVAAAALAIALDQLIRLMEVAATRRSRTLAITAGAALLGLFTLGIVPWLLQLRSETARPAIVIGAKTFTEQYILAGLLDRTLQSSGFQTTIKSSLGSTVIFDALKSDNIDCYVDYSGTIWTNILHHSNIPPRTQLMSELKQALKEQYGILMVGALGFENTYALALRQSQADKLQIKTIDDLARHSPSLTIGSDYEFFSRPEWAALKQQYDLRFAQQRTFDPSLMYAAVNEGQVDVISAYSTDGRIAAYNLLVLEDPKGALPPYDAVLLLSPRMANNDVLVRALQSLSGKIANETMRHANMIVDVEKRPVDDAVDSLRTLLR